MAIIKPFCIQSDNCHQKNNGLIYLFKLQKSFFHASVTLVLHGQTFLCRALSIRRNDKYPHKRVWNSSQALLVLRSQTSRWVVTVDSAVSSYVNEVKLYL